MAWKLFPITAGTKTPALAGDWRKHATSDPVVIEHWRAQGYDLAVDCGGSGLFVIDVDGEIGEATLRTLSPLSPTYTVRTPRGGRHLYYLGVGPNTVAGLGPKVDTRGPGGYVVWEGPGYEVVDGRAAVAVDHWVVPALNKRADRKPAVVDVEDLPFNVARARAYLQGRAPAVEGEGGNDHTYQTAAALRDLGVSEEKSLELMLDWNSRCIPEWEPDELAEVISHAWTYGQNEAGAQALAGDPRTRFLGVDHGPVLQPDDNPYRLWDVDEVLAMPEPGWLLETILPEESVGTLYSPPKLGKTFLLLELGLSLATGLGPYPRKQEGPKRVIYVTLEGFKNVAHKRIAAWCDSHEYKTKSLRGVFKLVQNYPDIGNEVKVDRFEDAITEAGFNPDLIVIDTYSRAMFRAGLNENDPLHVNQFIEHAEYLKRRYGCTVILVHHAGKDVKLGQRGSNALDGGVDFIWRLDGDKEVRAYKLVCEAMKDADEFDPLHFEAVPQSKSLVFRGITPDAYRVLTSGVDIFASQAVGTALVALGARDDDSAVTAYVLAHKLYKAEPGEPEQESAAAVDRIARKLSQMAKGRLEQYVTRAGWRVLR